MATALRESGMDVLLTGPWMQTEEIVSIAIQEDVEVIGISSLSSDHLLVPKLTTRLREEGLENILVIVGGVVPDADVPILLASGTARVFHPGTSLPEIIQFIEDRVGATRMAVQQKVAAHG